MTLWQNGRSSCCFLEDELFGLVVVLVLETLEAGYLGRIIKFFLFRKDDNINK